MIKFNNGNPVIICDKCRTTISKAVTYDGSEFKMANFCKDCAVYDNFDVIKDLLYFEPNSFYFCQVIQRKKDGNLIKDSIVIKSYYFHSLKEFLSSKEEIAATCKHYNARAYINLTPRNRSEVLALCIKEYADMMVNKIPFSPLIFDHCCGVCGNSKTFLIDVDEDVDYNTLAELIQSCRGEGRILAEVPTPNGYHLITSKFDRGQFKQKLAIKGINGIDVKDNSPTLLYYEKNC